MNLLGTTTCPGKPRRRGASLLMVTVIVTGLAMVTSAILPQLTAQSRQAQDAALLARALQAAEAGIDYETWWISHGMTPHQINEDANNGYKGECPQGSDNKFRVGVVREEPGRTLVIRSVGTVDGISRRLEVKIKPASPPFSLYGASPGGNAVTMRGNSVVEGQAGTNGSWTTDGTSSLQEGPILVAGPNAKLDDPNKIKNPVEEPVRTHEYPLQWPTVTGIANSLSGSNQGVRWYKSHNDNNAATLGGNRGIYYVYTNSLGATVEQPMLLGTNTVLTKTLITPPNVAGLTAVGIKFYPGDYYFTQINMDANHARILIHNLPVNGDASVKWWVDTTGSTDPLSQLCGVVDLADRNYSGRFWIYSTSKGTFRLYHDATPFYVNLYHYDVDSSGNVYGHNLVDSNTIVDGSIIGATIDVGGGAVIRLPPRLEDDSYPGPMNFLKVVSWKEMR